MIPSMVRIPIYAHGIGGRQDLPVPLGISVLAAVVVLVVSFVALAALWKTPRWQEPERPVVFGLRASRVVRPVLGIVGVLGLVLVVVSGVFGIDNSAGNPASVLVFVVFWLVVPFFGALVIDVYRWLDPWSRLAHWFGLDGEAPGAAERLGYLPATGALLVFTWLELISPVSGPRVLGIAAAVYTAYLMGMAWWVGPATGSRAGDAFAVYNLMLGGIAPYRIEAGGFARQGWLRGLVHLPERRGIDLFVVSMIGTVTYDGASSTPWWRQTLENPPVTLLADGGLSVSTASAVVGTVLWALTVGLVYLGYLAAAAAADRLGGSGFGPMKVASRFAHTLVPIAFAYAFAHYFTLVLFEGQLLLSTMSDPLGRGWDLFGTADRSIDYSLIAGTTAWVWYVQVAAIVTGHVGGVVLAHDRALADFSRERAVASQYAMLVLMVVLTGLGLVILAAG
jgi:hypothetical protein